MPTSSIVFLMYHELELPGRSLVQSEPGYVRYILTAESFRAQIDWLRRTGWTGLSVGEALQYPPQKAVAITFDDGCETDLMTAAPILKEAGFRATFYVTAGFLEKRGYMSHSQLRELSSLGFEIGCHSMTHAYLNDLAPSELHREVVESRARLEAITGTRVEHFSCPGGRWDDRAIAQAKQAGYRSLATSRTHANSASTDPFQLGRIAVMRGTDEAAFSRICSARGLWKNQFAESARDLARTLLGNKLYDRLRSRLLQES